MTSMAFFNLFDINPQGTGASSRYMEMQVVPSYLALGWAGFPPEKRGIRNALFLVQNRGEKDLLCFPSAQTFLGFTLCGSKSALKAR